LRSRTSEQAAATFDVQPLAHRCPHGHVYPLSGAQLLLGGPQRPSGLFVQREREHLALGVQEQLAGMRVDEPGRDRQLGQRQVGGRLQQPDRDRRGEQLHR